MTQGTAPSAAMPAARARLIRLAIGGFVWALLVFAIPDVVSTSVLNPMGAALAIAFVTGIDRVRHRTCWISMVTGAAVYATTDLLAAFDPIAGVSAAGFLVAYSCLAVALTSYVALGRPVAPRTVVVKMPRAGRRSLERLAKAA